jgi:CheY-like chemotaxis protein
MADMKKKIEDWMVRVSFAEAGAADEGFELTGEALDHKTKLAMERLRIVRSEMKPGAEGGAGERPGSAPELRLMIVDDEPIVGKRLKPALEKNGYQVEAHETGATALERIAQGDFDIVVTDIRMEPVDGLKVLDAALKKNSRTKVIVITGYATVELAREALSKGAFDVIAKPFRPDDLRDVIAKAARALESERSAR